MAAGKLTILDEEFKKVKREVFCQLLLPAMIKHGRVNGFLIVFFTGLKGYVKFYPFKINNLKILTYPENIFDDEITRMPTPKSL